MRALPLIGLLLVSLFAQAAVYKWVDKDGKVHYSDEPQTNSQVVELKENTQNQIKINTPPDLTTPKAAEEEGPRYQLTIISPDEEATVRDNNGDFEVVVSSEPELASRHYFELLLDGTVYGKAQSTPIFLLKGVDRGEHTLVVQAVAQNGKVLASSPTRTLFLHRISQILTPKATPRNGN